MKYLLFTSLVVAASIAVAQQTSSNPTGAGATIEAPSAAQSTSKANPIPNPFEANENGSSSMMGMGGMEMMMMGGGAGDAYAGDLGGSSDMMGMDMGMGMGSMGMQMSEEDKFRRGLQRAIIALGNAKSDPEKETLRHYVRQALENRYLKMIADRQQEVEKLKASVAKLESDLKRRESAKDRVIDVQMQSVQLAAEGLLQLGDFGGSAPGYGASGYGASGFSDGYGMESMMGSP